MSFEYPEHPNTGRTDPFRDEDGQNPFADDGPEADVSDDPYGVTGHDPGPTFVADHYETLLPHRGGRIFGLGIAGLIMSFFGTAGTIACVLSPVGAGSLLPLSAGLLLLGLPCAWTAWMTGRYDLRAMRVGAMDDAGQRKTRHGYAMGIAGTLIAIAPVVAAVVMFLRLLSEEL
jgi:hypothetical protein